MINSEISEARKSTPNKKDNKYKKSKCDVNYRKNVSGDQITRKNRNTQGNLPGNSKPAGTNVDDITSGLIGERVQVTVKNGARFQGILSEATSLTGDRLEISLKNACDISHAVKRNGLALATGAKSLTIKINDLLDVTPVKGPNGNNAFKADQKTNGNATRQTCQDSRRLRSTTTEVFCEKLAVALEPGHVDGSNLGFSNASLWGRHATTEKQKLPSLTSDFDGDLFTTKPDRSAYDFKLRDQKLKLLSNEARQFSRNKTCTLKTLYCVSEYQTSNDEDRPCIANTYTSNENKNYNENTDYRPQKSSTKTHDEKQTRRPNHRNGTYGQDATRDRKPTTPATQRNYGYSKMGTAPYANSKNNQWSIDTSKNVYKHDRQHKEWTRNDTDVTHDNTAINRQKYSYKNDMNSAKSITSNENLLTLPPSSAPFKLNIMATEFIPHAGAHALLHDLKPRDIPSSTSTSSSASSLSAPHTPPLRTQLVSLNEMFPAPFNKPAFSAPSNTDPLWQCGRTSYRHHKDFTSLPSTYWQINNYSNLHQLYYGYQHGGMAPCVPQPYLPYHQYHQSQQFKHNPRTNFTMVYSTHGSKNHMKDAANQQPYLGALSYQNYY